MQARVCVCECVWMCVCVAGSLATLNANQLRLTDAIIQLQQLHCLIKVFWLICMQPKAARVAVHVCVSVCV